MPPVPPLDPLLISSRNSLLSTKLNATLLAPINVARQSVIA